MSARPHRLALLPPSARLPPSAPRPPYALPERPRTCAECPDGPCPFVGCRYHTLPLRRGVDWHDDDAVLAALEDLPETCALRVADEGGATLDRLGGIIGCTREGARVIEGAAVAVARRRARMMRLHVELGDGLIEAGEGFEVRG